MDPLDFEGIRTYPLASRKSKVTRADLARTFEPDDSFERFLDALPNILAVPDLKYLAGRIVAARRNNRAVLLGLGAHVIKVGLSPLLIDLLERGLVTGLALNGAGIVHDFEMAWQGATSEEVGEVLGSGNFGMAEETGRMLNLATREAAQKDLGLGRGVGEMLLREQPPHLETSLLAAACRLDLPATVHVAVGTDILHIHPQADGAAIGQATHRDFRLFCRAVTGLDDGGVYLNVGSAVLLPEVFLKAVTVVRNLGYPLGGFTTANFDFIRQYRPLTNVVHRPVQESGKGYNFVGHHELTIPLLYGLVRSLSTT
jgi:hypothetical protein